MPRIRSVFNRTTGTSPFPSSVAASVFEHHLARIQTRAFGCEMSDLCHRNVVGGDVIHGKTFFRALRREQHRRDYVENVDVRLALSSIAENPQPARILQELPQEIKIDSVRLPRANDVAESEGPRRQIEHVAVSADQHLSRELAGAEWRWAGGARTLR